MVGGDSHGEAGVGDEPDRTRHSSDRVNPARQTHDVTRILSQIEHGDPNAAEQLLPLVYDELRKLAAQKLINEKPGQTLQATALVHEAYIRLVDVDKAQHWNSRGHFFGAAAEAMRRILVNRARRQRTYEARWRASKDRSRQDRNCRRALPTTISWHLMRPSSDWPKRIKNAPIW